MKNEVFTNVAQEAAAFREAYAKKAAAAEARLEQLQADKAKAKKAADAAVLADDQAAWVKADKAMTEATVGIKYTQERLAVIHAGAKLPLSDYIRLREQLQAEQGRIKLAFVEKVQQHGREIQEELRAMQAELAGSADAVSKLYAAAGSPDDGYRRIQDDQPNWGIYFNGLDNFLSFDLADKNTIKLVDQLGRMVYASLGAIENVEKQGGTKDGI